MRFSWKSWRPGFTWRNEHLHVEVNFDMINWPRLHLDPERRYIAFTWGNGLSDPVLMVELHR